MTATISLGNKIRTLRKARGMRQADLAAAIGMSRSHLAGIEAGHGAPGREILVALAQFLDVPLDWLAARQGEPVQGSAAAKTEDEALWLFAFRSLPEPEAQHLLNALLHRVGRPKN